ncbi:MAG: hypothetical protein N3A55_10150 [Methylohalobius sp.]|nr:hypothetical protein [Methylohalobius sp.]
MFKNKYSLLLWAVYVVALYVILDKAVVPFALWVANSEVFTGDASQGGEPTQVHDDRTEMALLQCKRLVQDKFDEKATLVFEDTNYQAWDVGFGRFLIKAQVDVTEPNSAPVRKNYVCEIRHTGGDLAERGNWKLQGLSLNDVAAAARP